MYEKSVAVMFDHECESFDCEREQGKLSEAAYCGEI